MTDDIFLERKNYSEIIEKRILSLKEGYRQNIAIIGDELVGKTSIIFKMLNKFCDSRILMIYIEAQPESLSSFSKRFIGVLLYNFLANSHISLKENLDFLIEKSSKYIPKTIEKIKLILNSLEKRKSNNIFTELLCLCETINQETGKFCVVIFDEFHHLENTGIKDLYVQWPKLLISQKNTMYIVISSRKFKAQEILAKNLSLLFGNFETLAIEPFSAKDSESYLEQKLNKVKLDAGLKNFIVDFTGGYPFYLKVIADAILKSGRNNNLPEIIEGLLFESSSPLYQKFSNYIKRFMDLENGRDFILILYLVSSGHNKPKEIAQSMHKPKKELDPKVTRLLELDAITRSGDFLKINDRVFAFWLKLMGQQKCAFGKTLGQETWNHRAKA